MLHLRQTVIVEGKYDKARLAAFIDANIITTDGFDIFRDRAKLQMIRALAARDGIVILTDSDHAGFRIRRHIAGAVPPEQVTHVYIPDMPGKERRKPKPGAEGLLGVEGIPDKILLEAFIRAGLDQQEAPLPPAHPVTSADLMELGLSGGENSRALRAALLKALGLPSHMGPKALLRTINALYSREDFFQFVQTLTEQE